MKKYLTFLLALGFFATTTLSVSACGVGNGKKIDTNITNAPQEAKDGADPLKDYVYNNKYTYVSGSVNVVLGIAAQLVVDKIKADPSVISGDKSFLNSEVWKSGSFSSFNYGQETVKSFSFQVANNNILYYSIKDNDLTKDENRLAVYWFTTSKDAWSNTASTFKPDANNINIPNINQFTDDNPLVTELGNIHVFLVIGDFQIDFNAEITFTFSKITDKNNASLVILNAATFEKPFGNITFKDHSEGLKHISNIYISKVTPKQK